MSLTPGTSLGAYEIVSKLGEGGMGQVYQARDTKLNRVVALKILPPAFANDADRLARFKREAQVLASLNHPNIAIIHGFEDSGDTHALVMELVPGQTLAELIASSSASAAGRESLQPEATGVGPRRREGSRAPRGLRIDDALPLAHQIASALEAAHEQGVVHRDLKPANVKVTDDGTVKVLDFGLAKLAGREGAANSASATAQTSTSPAMTEMGVILGTAGYMSPEQAKGKPVDRRADIWAFGVVLFELLAGKSLYSGDTVNETIANVITQPPDWSALPETTPGQVRRLLRRCLEKDPRSRYQSAGDVRLEIEEILSGVPAGDSGPIVLAPPAVQTPAWRRWLPWGLATVLLVAFAYTLRPRPAAPERAMRFEMRLGGEDLSIDDNLDGPLAVLSPDGSTIVYLGTIGPLRRLYRRSLEQLESQPIAGTEGAQHQFFSPDGQSLAFFANGSMVRTPTAGGAITPITPAQDARGATWGPDDTIVFTANTATGLSRVPATGGKSTELTTLGPNERTHRWPWFLPGGRSVLFMCQLNNEAYDDGTIEALRLDTGERKVLVRGGTFPRYVEGGYLVFSRGNNLLAVAFNPDTLELRGDPRPVLTGVFSTGGGVGGAIGNGSTQIAFASNGTAVYLPGQMTTDSTLTLAVVNRAGKIVYEYPETRAFRDPTFSRDGRRLFVRVADGKAEHIHVLDPARGTLTKIIFEGSFSGIPVMAPDNVHMAFSSDRAGGGISAYIGRNDGTGSVTPITSEDKLQLFPTSFSPDGRYLAVSEVNPKSAVNLLVVSLADGKVQPFLATPASEMIGVFSPDGRWMAYQGAEGPPLFEVFVRAFPDGGALRQISTGGGFLPRWTKGGRELVYGAPSDLGMSVMAVEVTTEGPALVLGKPQKLFELPIPVLSNAISYDVTENGSNFAVILRSGTKTSLPKRTHVTIVFNFFDEIRKATAK
jgi:serine/threonine protein kinase/dipeptidyl aminopeptidase/acylaminoacyl peptidase